MNVRARSTGARSLASRFAMASAIGVLVFALLSSGVVPALASGSSGRDSVSSQAQSSPGWMSAETAARLDLGFAVLVPGSVPAPFSGEPGVYAAGGYYSLYWVMYGGPPTFLEVTGEIGGDIPDGSAYDLNVPLVQNASVQGYPAYHDPTPIYDTVWWRAGDIVYKVSSQGLAGTGSLALANALMTLVPPSTGGGETGGGGPGGVDPGAGDPGGGNPGTAPAPAPDDGVDASPAPNPIIIVPEVVVSGEVATIAVEGISGATLQADAGAFTDTGSAIYDGVGGFSFTWEAPAVDIDQTLGFVLVDPIDGQWLATASTQVLASGEEGIAPDPDGVGGASSSGAGDESDGDGDGTGSLAPGPVRPGTTTSNLTGTIAMTCPTVAYSGRLMPIKLAGSSPAIVNSTLGGWPVEPGNRSFDPAVDGGPALIGGVADDANMFIHWRAPTVGDVTLGRFYLTHPDGTALAECEVSVQPGGPPARRPAPQVQTPPEHDGSGGPFPFEAAPLGGADEPLEPEPFSGDGSGGPTVPRSDGSGGPMVLPVPDGDGSGGPG